RGCSLLDSAMLDPRRCSRGEGHYPLPLWSSGWSVRAPIRLQVGVDLLCGRRRGRLPTDTTKLHSLDGLGDRLHNFRRVAWLGLRGRIDLVVKDVEGILLEEPLFSLNGRHRFAWRQIGLGARHPIGAAPCRGLVGAGSEPDREARRFLRILAPRAGDKTPAAEGGLGMPVRRVGQGHDTRLEAWEKLAQGRHSPDATELHGRETPGQQTNIERADDELRRAHLVFMDEIAPQLQGCGPSRASDLSVRPRIVDDVAAPL